MDKVIVLMSTYNGEKYIEQQLESIFNQKGVDVSLFVRDDGSTDSTISILKKWSKKYSLNWYQGENLRPPYSFLEAVKNSDNSADFFAYADQDDVWFETKLYDAIEMLKKYNHDNYNLYVSTYDVVDSNLNIIYKRNMHFENICLEGTIMEACPSGCTMVFNKKLKMKIAESDPSFIRMHDYWTLLTVEAYKGNIIFDENSTMMYRQHDSNEVGENKGKLIKIKRLFRSAFLNKNERQKQAQSLLDSYNDLSQEVTNRIKLITNYRKSIKNQWILLTDKKYRTNSFRTNALFKISVIFRVF